MDLKTRFNGPVESSKLLKDERQNEWTSTIDFVGFPAEHKVVLIFIVLLLVRYISMQRLLSTIK